MNECDCIPKKLYLWTLKIEFHTFFMHYEILFLLISFNHFKCIHFLLRTKNLTLNNFPPYHIAALAIVNMLHITFLVIIYFIAGSLYLLNTFFHFPFLLLLFAYHKSGLFSGVFFFFFF